MTEKVIEYFEDKLFQEVDPHMGFRTIAKAADNSLCDRDELALGHLSDQELAKEVTRLEDYLALADNIYYKELLKGVVHRLRFLSGRLKRLEGKEVIDMKDPTPNLSMLIDQHSSQQGEHGKLFTTIAVPFDQDNS